MELAVMALSNFAEDYDLPVEDPRHRIVRDERIVEDLYYLSWFRNFNEFRVTYEEFRQHWYETIVRELPNASWLLKSASREFVIIWLKAKYRQSNEHALYPIPKETKEDRAVILILEDPTLTDEMIQKMTKATTKSMQRWGTFKYARREMRLIAERLRNES